jgi:hypothetical protein
MEAFCREHTSSFDSFDWLKNVVSEVYGVSRVQSRMEGFQLGDKVHPRASVSIFFVVVCGVVHHSSSLFGNNNKQQQQQGNLVARHCH